MFQAIQPGGAATLDIAVIPRVVGKVDAVFSLETSHGSALFNVGTVMATVLS